MRNIRRDEKCFRIKIKKMSDLTGFYSPEIYVRISWRVKIYTTKFMSTKTITICLHCVHSGTTTDWSCKARAVFLLISFKAPLEWKFKVAHDFTQTFKSYVTKRFVSWHDLLDVNNGYIKNDSIVLDIDIIVQKPVGILSIEAATCPICLQILQRKPISSTLCGLKVKKSFECWNTPNTLRLE